MCIDRITRLFTAITDDSIFLYKLCGLLDVFLCFSKNKQKRFAPNSRLYINILKASGVQMGGSERGAGPGHPRQGGASKE